MPTIDLPDDELAAVTAAVKSVVAGDRYPHAPRLDPLRAALARLDAAKTVARDVAANAAPASKSDNENRGANRAAAANAAPALTSDAPPKAPPPAKADKRTRR